MTTEDSIDAHPAALSELPQVISALERAFFYDRIYRWTVPDDGQRRQSVHAFYSLFAEACWPHGAVYTTAAGSAAALWLPPGQQLVADEDAVSFGRSLVEATGDEASAARMAEVLGLLDEHHPSEPCWYLAFVGVDPSSQGEGIGSALLSVVLAQADIDSVPAYLDASCPESQRLYERHGFRTMRELTVSDCPPFYAMWREPAG
jgi:ribosomal protein S18 acetylase RimI-like enzyme